MYSLPRVYVGKRVTVRISGGLVRIFFQEKEIRRYTVPSGHRAYREEDFPESSRAFMNGTYPDFLKRSARENFGDAAADFIELVLKPNANLNARRALAFFPLFKRYFDLPLFSTVIREAVSRRITSPAYLKARFEDERRQIPFAFVHAPSPTGRAMSRDISYYLN
jgi:hypothetical protein